MHVTASTAVPLVAALLLGSCTAGPAVTLDPLSDLREARRLLADTAAEGPVLVTVRGEAPLGRAALLAAVERGVRGLDLETTVRGNAATRFVLDFSGGSLPLCEDVAAGRDALDNGPVRAAFCEGDRPVALAGADPAGDPERLIWRLVGRLVPDDYPDTYGFDLFGNRVSFGFGAGFGF